MGELSATWGLVVGVDPASEDALIGLSKYVQGKYLTTGTAQVLDELYNRVAVGVPVLTAARSRVPGALTVTVSTLDGVPPEQVAALYQTSGGETGAPLQAAIEHLQASGTLHRVS